MQYVIVNQRDLYRVLGAFALPTKTSDMRQIHRQMRRALCRNHNAMCNRTDCDYDSGDLIAMVEQSAADCGLIPAPVVSFEYPYDTTVIVEIGEIWG